jgi:hypothetical protein
MLVDLVRVVGGSPAFLSVYPVLSFGLGFVEAILLFTGAVGAYLRPNGSTYSLFGKDLLSRPKHFAMLLLFVAGTAVAEFYLLFAKPYSIVTASDFAGGAVMAVRYSLSFSVGIGVLFLFFLAYPVGLLVLGARRMKNTQMKRAQLGLAVGFAVSTAVYLFSSISLLDYGFDLTALTYAFLAVFFGLMARNFRHAALLAGFVSAAPAPSALQEVPSASRARSTSGDPVILREGELALLEVDTSSKFEERLDELVRDFRNEKRGVFLVSTKGSRLHSHFASLGEVRLYTMSESQHYIAPSQDGNEVNIPLFDAGVLLQVLDSTLSSAEPVSVIFDSISDMIVYLGFQPCYKFLRQAGEMVSGKKAIALFIMFSGAHDEKSITAVRSLFSSQLRLGPEGYVVVR